MSRFAVYAMPGSTDAYVLDVQADLLSDLATRVVVPLLPRAARPTPLRELNPVFDINGSSFVMQTQAIATVPVKELKQPVLSLAPRSDDVTRALDILLTGL